MLQYKVRKDHRGWFGQEALQGEGCYGALVQDLNRKLTACRAFCYTCDYCVPKALMSRCAQTQAQASHAGLEAADAATVCSAPGYGVWIRIEPSENPLASLNALGRAACSHPW